MNKGFTLIELLIVLGILAIIIGAIVVAVKPLKQFAQARNIQRQAHLESILKATYQNIIDNKGIWNCQKGDLPTSSTTMRTVSSLPEINVGLVGYWKFDEKTGNIADDSSGNNNQGLLVNNPSWSVGKVGGALSFDGANDFVNVPDSGSLYLSSGLTVALWAKGSGVKISKGELGGTQREWNIDNNSFNIFDQSAGGAIYMGRNFPAPSATEWHHLVAIWSGGTAAASIKVYVDGAQVDNSDSVNGVFVNMDDGTSPVRIGKREELQFNGLLDGVRIYNRALSDKEVKLLNLGSVYDICDCLVPVYLAQMPFDPSAPGAHFANCADYDTQYQIFQNVGEQTINVSSPYAELGQEINLTR